MTETTDSSDIAHAARAAVEQLTLAEKASLGGGESFWATKSVGAVPGITLSDGPHGVRFQSDAADHLGLAKSDPATCFPPAVGLAQSWDPELAERVGAALAQEAQAMGLGVLLGPGVNIKRDPRCGRNFEYLSEDPLLTGVLGSAWVRGLQSGGVGASLKHFAANNSENDRMRADSLVDERPLREIYLRAFERIVRDTQPWTVMCSYNRINGVHAAENTWLLTDVLRKEWGFDGAVVSDWGAAPNRVAAVAAGLDLQMPGNTAVDDAEVARAVEEKRLDPAAVDRAATAVAQLALRAHRDRRDVTVDHDAHHRLAREAAVKSVVLLKNDGATLPLPPTGAIAVIGAFAAEPRYQGGGSSHVVPTQVDKPLDEIRAAAPDADVRYAPGFSTDGTGDPATLRDEAVDIASRSDVAVVFIGLAELQESEGFDREDIELPDTQLALVKSVAAVQPNTVVVVSAGGVLRLAPVHDAVPAVLSGALLGQGGGHAIAHVLFGAANPSGRTAETVPLRLEDAPSFLDFPAEHSRIRYSDGIFVGYRGYDLRDQQVLYPFGFGLSYTSFRYDGIALSPDGDDLIVTVTVTNTGERAGREVVQVYASLDTAHVRVAPRQLVGFSSIDLQPGQTGTVDVRVERRDLAYWDDRAHAWIVEGGSYRVAAAASSRDVRAEAIVDVVGDPVVVPFDMESTFGELLSHPVAGPAIIRVFGSAMPQGADNAIGTDMAKMMEWVPVGRSLKTFAGGGADAMAQFQQMLDSINAQGAAAPGD